MGQYGGYDYRPMSVLQIYYSKVSNGNVRYDSHYDAEGLVTWKCSCGVVYFQGQFVEPKTGIDNDLEAWCKEHSHGAKVLPINYKEIRENVKNLIQEQVGPEYSIKLSENEIEYIASQTGVYQEIAIKQAVLGQLVMFNVDEPKRNALQVDVKNLTESIKTDEKKLAEQQEKLKNLQQEWDKKQVQEMKPILFVKPKSASLSIVKPASIIEPEAPKIPVLETNGRRIFRDE